MAENDSDEVDRLEKLIQKGEDVLATHTPNPSNVVGFPTLDSGAFSGWRAQALSFLGNLLGEDHVYYEQFDSKVNRRYPGNAKSGIEILKAVREDVLKGDLDEVEEVDDPTAKLERLFDRFHRVVRQLRSRHEDRETLSVQDEYDVQGLKYPVKSQACSEADSPL